MDKVLKDGSGIYALSGVVAITPLRFKDGRTNQLIKEHAQLHMASGEVLNTQTDYTEAWTKWQALVNPPPAAPAAAASGQSAAA